MTLENCTPYLLGAFAALHLAACGAAGTGHAQTTATVGAAGATLQAGSAKLSIPAGALSTPTAITLREAEPRHAGRTKRIEVEPNGLRLAINGQLVIAIDDSNVKPRLHDDDDQLVPVEIEDRPHGEFKTGMGQLGAIEVELEHGLACTPACAAGEECDDGACKPHVDDAGARACDPICASGQECDDGACKPHGELAPAGGSACMPACAADLECDAGVCKPHRSGGA